uniref:Uncharacterized protein n=1 Tax=Lotus japonicus TaxID=34305 RepID=I3STK3_LOTJA|nr:unknown [Lotus japonicus]
MKGYSKISTTSGATHKSRSIDFSDLLSSFPQTPKARTKTKSTSTAHTAKLPEDEEQPNYIYANTREGEAEGTDKTSRDENGERFGVILGRSGSISSATSTGFQATMKRAFSMRRSSSVSDKYCRIHDQFIVNVASSSSSSPVTVRDHYDDDNNNTIADRSTNNNKHRGGGGKILRACKRLLRL